jgi:CHAT domain-containing protein/Big-like domain-containing protein
MEYLDFEVAIDVAADGTYRVAVLRSPAGQTQEVTRLPFDEAQLQARLAALGDTLVRARGTRDVVPASADSQSGQTAAREFGGALFETLFVGDVRSLFVQSLREATQEPGRGLRVRFRTQVPELAALPWELLYDRRPGSFVCLSSATPFVRFLDVQQPADALVVGTRLNILGMVASPAGLPALDVAREKARMEEATADSRRRGLVNLTWLEGQTWRALKDGIGPGSGPWHVFHFIGHGGLRPDGEGYLALSAEQRGGRYDLAATSLSDLLANHRTLRLTVLNACEGAKGSGDLFSSTAATLVRRGLPAVVSMQREISDQAAIEFAREFYRTLALGYPVDGAVAEARVAMSLALPGSVEWATPMLHMRSADGVLFNVQPPPPPTLTNRLARWWTTRTKATRRTAVALPLVIGALAAVRAFWPVPPPVTTRIAFYHDTATVLPSQSTGLQVWALDSGGNRIALAKGLAWSSSDTSVAKVAPLGSEAEVTAVAPGFAQIRADRADGEHAEARVTVLVPVASVEVQPQKHDLTHGSSLQLNVTLRDGKGGFLQGRDVRWRSGNDTVATVSASGMVTAYDTGVAIVTATSEDHVGKALIHVTDAHHPEVGQPAAAIIPGVTVSFGTIQSGTDWFVSGEVENHSGQPLVCVRARFFMRTSYQDKMAGKPDQDLGSFVVEVHKLAPAERRQYKQKLPGLVGLSAADHVEGCG